MSEKTMPSKNIPSWFSSALAVLLLADLTLTWMNGRMLQRQFQEFRGLREDFQSLIEELQQENPIENDGGTESLSHNKTGRKFLKKTAMLVRVSRSQSENKTEENTEGNGEKEPVVKEIETTRESAKKAVKDAREVRSKLSLEENARKAEEKAKLNNSQNILSKWLLAGLGLFVAVITLRIWLRRRE